MQVHSLSVKALWLPALSLIVILSVFAAQQSQAAIVKGNTCDAIQKTINKLPAIGGEVFIPAGVYTCSTPIRV